MISNNSVYVVSARVDNAVTPPGLVSKATGKFNSDGFFLCDVFYI